jgi:3-phosphoshikimate 1-carboxyvinyltransferase
VNAPGAARLVVRPSRTPLSGSVPVPSDKSISHRAVILAALSSGTCTLAGFSHGADNVATLEAFRKMGVSADDDGKAHLSVHGVGLAGLREPSGAIDCGNSGTTMRLLAGVLAGQPFRSRLIGDVSLSRRPMGRVVQPLRARGGVISGVEHPTRPNDVTAPLDVGPLPADTRLGPLSYELEIPSAQVKSALLLSGLFATGPTVVKEPIISRDHTERMLDAIGMPVERVGSIVSLHPPADPLSIAPFSIELPGDLSAAAFLLVAATLVEGSHVGVRRCGLNPTRSGILDVLRLFGGHFGIQPQGEALGEPLGEVSARSSRLRGATVSGELSVRSIDEIPIACALAARARGQSEFLDIAELRVKESDRIALMVEVLQAFGVVAAERPEGLVIEGRPDGRLSAARVTSGGDHRIAMTAAVLALVADGETVIDDVDCIATSFPRFIGTLRALGADIEVER